MLKPSYNSLIDLILSTIIAVIIITISHYGSHASTELISEENCDLQEVDRDLCGPQQTQDWENEMEGEPNREVTEPIEFEILALKSC